MSPKPDDFRQRIAILSLKPFPSDPDDTALLTRPKERAGRFRHVLATCTCQIPSGGNVSRSKCPMLIGTTTSTAGELWGAREPAPGPFGRLSCGSWANARGGA